MKHKPLLILGATALFLSFSSLVNAQQTAKTVPVEVLKAREAVLKETTKLNSLKIKLSKATEQNFKLVKEVAKANESAQKASAESKTLSAKMGANAGDQKLAKKAKNASKNAYDANKKAAQLTADIHANQKNIVSLQNNIEKSKAKIAKMDQQLKFVGTAKVK